MDIEDEKGNIPAAYAYLRELTTLKDSLQVKANQEQVNELEARYQSEKKIFRSNYKRHQSNARIFSMLF